MNAPIKPLQWSEHRKPDEIIRYDHVLAESPIGLFSIEWKSWKEHDSYAVYLDSEYIADSNDIADAMLIADRRVAEVADNLIDLSSLATVTAQRDRLLEALEFYAQEQRYYGANQRCDGEDKYTPTGRPCLQDVTRDQGDIARTAIASVKGGAV